MQIQFPQEQIPSDEIEPYYKHIMKMHMHFEKIALNQNLSYMKYATFFVIAYILFTVLGNKGILSNSSYAILFTGIGVLISMIFSLLFISKDTDYKLAQYSSIGRYLESQHPQIINMQYFTRINSHTQKHKMALILLRFFPLAVVLLIIGLISIHLVMK